MAKLAGRTDSIRLGYTTILDRLARLTSYANSYEVETETDINQRQNSLFVDDFIVFALNARRFLTEVGYAKEAQKVEVPLVKFNIGEKPEDIIVTTSRATVSAYRILNIAIHHKMLDVFRSKFDVYKLLIPRAASDDEIIDFYVLHQDLTRQGLHPVLAIKSEESKIVVFQLSVFLRIFSENIFHPAVERCEERGLYLTSFFTES
ncbi:hypothetical protein [Ferrovibrio sp.]|uniref:hypothetical protein n=1 Tax=Ferrovibrio sp. TaxID=1917215 RepID=UPI003D27EA0A